VLGNLDGILQTKRIRIGVALGRQTSTPTRHLARLGFTLILFTRPTHTLLDNSFQYFHLDRPPLFVHHFVFTALAEQDWYTMRIIDKWYVYSQALRLVCGGCTGRR
jgi:hypothetical protein